MDHFPCGCLITTQDRKILFANRYFTEQLGWPPGKLVGRCVNALFSRSSQLFCDSYIVPTVFKEGRCCEVQISILTADGARVPKVASVQSMPNGNMSWIFTEAEKRDRLFNELETARLSLEDQRQQLENLAQIDALTGIANRRGFDAALERAFCEADRAGSPVSVMLIDVDRFKVINDTHGHIVGDQALFAVASAIKTACRRHDTIARFGGDEFACILADTTLDDAKDICLRIHEAISDHLIGVCAITLSVGVSGRTAEAPLGSDGVLSLADKALFDAKTAGRNSTVIRKPDAIQIAVSG